MLPEYLHHSYVHLSYPFTAAEINLQTALQKIPTRSACPWNFI